MQNSWGPNWGKSGLALWSYEDWNKKVRDAWVVQLALSTRSWAARPGPMARDEERCSAAFKGRRAPGTEVLKAFLDAFAAKGAKAKAIHLVGHSTDAILHAHLVKALKQLNRPLRLASVDLLAPACRVDLFEACYLKYLARGAFGIDRLDVYNLRGRLERDAKVLAGVKPKLLKFNYSNGIAGRQDRTNSTTHGGFDNDPATVNSVLKNVLGDQRIKKRFTRTTLDY